MPAAVVDLGTGRQILCAMSPPSRSRSTREKAPDARRTARRGLPCDELSGGGQRNLFNGFRFHEIHELFLGVDVQLGVDVAHVGAGGAFGDEQLLLDEGSVAPFR